MLAVRRGAEFTVFTRKLVLSFDDVGKTAAWGVGGVGAVARVVREELVSECDLCGERLGVSATSLGEGTHDVCGVYGNCMELPMKGRVPRVLELVRARAAEDIRGVGSGPIGRGGRLVPGRYDGKEHECADGGA